MQADEWIIETQGDTSSRERLETMLNQAFPGLTGWSGKGPWALLADRSGIQCRMTIERGRKEFCDKTGAVVAEFLVSEKEPLMLRRHFQRKFGIREAVEADVLVSEAIALLDGEPTEWPEGTSFAVGRGRENRVKKLGQRFGAFLVSNGRLNIDGFIRFRMRDYEAEICEAAETAVEERLMERQYQEFMSLLQTMVEWQEVRVQAVHVLHGGGHAFQLLDEKMRPLEREHDPDGLRRADAGPEEDDQEEESMLVSRLLAVSPRHLYIHTPEPDAQVIRTLMGIFGERAVCTVMPKV
ncbi:putative sporulation protein YtxC [Cohnella nanjingensis]|uniref:Putative sporulation protein YtxC n=1 Tax=Cohnella nanjingensis TaxID=1387779 RepID=A0A7X0RLH3_9BACL|nr:putative sporulation protein YtxC [Cohnella nanjingensis]MBB6669677.1 putative sporulation protein YtxC [Cohnella nanjingensis]